MRILFWYILRQHTEVFLLCFTGLAAIHLVLDFSERLKTFLPYGAKFITIVTYVLLKLPEISFRLAPLAVLLATLVTLGLLNKNQEMTAMRSAGISPSRIAAPFLAFGLIVTLMMLAFTTIVIPLSNGKANYIKNFLIEKRPQTPWFEPFSLWLRTADDAIMNVGRVESKGALFKAVTLYRFDAEFAVSEIVHASAARYTVNGWILDKVKKYDLLSKATVTLHVLPTLPIQLSHSPENLRTMFSVATDEMTFNEFRSYVDRLEKDGHGTAGLLSDFWGRIAFSCLSLVVTILGIGLGLMQTGTRGTSIVRPIAQGLGIAFLYLVVLSTGVILGRSGVLLPVLGGWVATLLLLAVSLVLFLKARC